MRSPIAKPHEAEGIAIVIPCYRVADHIGDVIRAIPCHYRMIICVDDASPDDLAGAIDAIGDPRVTLLRHERNRGVGGAMKTGFAEALRRGAAICVKMDGDGQMAACDLDALVAPLIDGSADCAKGNRFVNLRALEAMPFVRLVGNAMLSFASKLASGYWNMLDVTNGFVALRSSVLREIDLNALSDRYFFETSLLVELNIRRALIADVDLPARYGAEQSSMRLGDVMLTFPWLLTRALLRRFYWRYLIEDFGIASISVLLGLPLVTFGVSFGLYHWNDSVATGVPATAGTVFVAALPIILGVQLLLVAVMIDILSSRTIKRRAGQTRE